MQYIIKYWAIIPYIKMNEFWPKFYNNEKFPLFIIISRSETTETLQEA